jgi:hypothetical protein
MPDVIQTITVDAPAKVPVDVVAHEADIPDLETYRAAKQGDWTPPVKEAKAAETATAQTETPTETKQVSEGEEPSSEAKAQADSVTETEQTETTQEKGDEKGKKRNPIAPRIDELVKQRDIARDENRQLKAKIEELEKLPQAPAIPDTGEPKKPARPKAPNPLDEKFKTTAEYNVAHEQYEKDLDKYETDLQGFNDFHRSKTQREEAVKQQEAALKQRFGATIAKAIEDNRFGDDFKPYGEPQKGGPPVSKLMTTFLPRLEDPAAILYYLQKNPTFAQSLHDVFDGPAKDASSEQRDIVLYQLGRLDGLLIGTEKAAKATARAETTTPKPPTPPENKVTTKPPQKPPVTLNGSSGEVPVKKLTDAADQDEYRRLKKAGAGL